MDIKATTLRLFLLALISLSIPAFAKQKKLPVVDIEYQPVYTVELEPGAKSSLRLNGLPHNIDIAQISKVGLESSRDTRILGRRTQDVAYLSENAFVQYNFQIADNSIGEIFKVKLFTKEGEGYRVEESIRIIVKPKQKANSED